MDIGSDTNVGTDANADANADANVGVNADANVGVDNSADIDTNTDIVNDSCGAKVVYMDGRHIVVVVTIDVASDVIQFYRTIAASLTYSYFHTLCLILINVYLY